jgi:hypothetical protein
LKSKKDISDQIRENAHKLEERPSRDAWERLENRLAEHRAKRRFSLYKWVASAAAVIGIIGFVSAISFMFRNENSTFSANEEFAVQAFKVEELEVPDAEQGFYKVVEFQNTYKNRLSNPIIEGSGKRLSVANTHRNSVDDSAR